MYRGMTKLKLTEIPRDRCDLQNKEANFMENLVLFIDSLAHSTDASESLEGEKQDPHEEEEWAEEAQKLVSLYK